MIDAGLSARQVVHRMELAGVDPASLNGVLITHEHIDHVGALRVLCKRFEIPVYCNPLTAEAIGRDLVPCWRLFETGSEFSINDIAVQSFSVPHDAVDPVGFVLRSGNVGVGLVTDLGHPTKLVAERVRSVRLLIVETNHDEKLLQLDTRRPWAVKQRIMSRHGHLSNDAAARFVRETCDESLQQVVLCHLSRDCNAPELALGSMNRTLAEAGRDLPVYCASQVEPSPRFLVTA